MGELARDPSSIPSFPVVSPGTAPASVAYGFGPAFRGRGLHEQLGATGDPPTSLMSLLFLPPPPYLYVLIYRKDIVRN